VLYIHAVWFVLGAVEFELPVCAKSWWNIDQSSPAECSSEVAVDSASPERGIPEKTAIKNTNVIPRITFLFVLFPFLLNARKKGKRLHKLEGRLSHNHFTHHY
jgi:hypothetical protein